MARRKPSRFFNRLLILVVLGGLAFVGLAAFRIGPPPSVSVEAGMPGIGKRTPFDISVAEPKRGLSGVRIELVQGERVEMLEEREYESLAPWEFWGERMTRENFSIEIGSENSILPLLIGALTDLPLVDADAMGRAKQGGVERSWARVQAMP